MMAKTYKDKLNFLKKEAARRGLKIKKDKRLTKTPYRASHPLVEDMIGVKNKGKFITYEPRTERNKRRLVMDINHEICEFDLMKKGYSYRHAHKISNRKQRKIGC